MRSRIQIRIEVTSWIWIRIKVKIYKLFRGSRAVEGRGRSQWRPGGSKWSPGGSVDQWSQIAITLMRSRIRIRIEAKS
jgi:hypothetical protein